MRPINNFIQIALFFFICAVCQCADLTIDLERIEAIKGKDNNVDFSGLRVIKKGRNHYINGSFTYHSNMRSQYTYGIKTSQSPTGNSRFIDKPFFTLDQTPMCYFYNVTFKEFLRPALTGSSTFPEIPKEGLCPIPKGTYYVKDLAANEDKIPFKLSRGLWKLEATIHKGSTLVGGYRVFARVEENH